MHIPDGFLDTKTVFLTTAVSAVGLGAALRHLKKNLSQRQVPLIGLAAAFIFVAQMVNFPIAGGTSGHLVGAVLASVLMGPSAAVLVISSVLILQCFLFADGGVTALGANMFNMAILAPIAGNVVYVMLSRCCGDDLRGRLFGTAFGAWVSIVAASVACAGELAFAGTVAWRLAFPAMANIHMLIGLGEALITTLIVAAIARLRPELLSAQSQANLRPRLIEFVNYGLLAVGGLAVFVVPFACGWPDGLEKMAASLGFQNKTFTQPLTSAPLADYTVPGLGSAVASTEVAGVVGLVVSFLLAYLLAFFLTPPAKSKSNEYHATSSS